MILTTTRPVPFFPAHAGKTKSQGGCQGCGWAHPHSRGENIDHKRVSFNASGSSPLTRGKHGLRRPLIRLERLIPAHAGKTRSARPSVPRGPAHPRSRGENIESEIMPEPGRGSSPLTRGKLLGKSRAALDDRLIPAHAGKTRRLRPPPPLGSAHPRSRGENRAGDVLHAPLWGSSPLTRGKLWVVCG